ncbi:MAG: UDP-N-acetylmuramoyl-tripeptide--D-alanyl-D-alanine ligase [Chloroflexota bacterium]
MALIRLSEVLTGLAGHVVAVSSEAEMIFRDVVIDSRMVTPGSLFVALRGEHQDGHAFVSDAFARGAAGAIVERPMEGYVTLSSTDCWQVADLHQPICMLVPDAMSGLQQIAAHWRRLHAKCKVVGITGSVGKTTTKELVAAVLSRCYETVKSEGNYNNEIGLPLTLLGLANSTERAVLEMAMYDIGEIALLANIALPDVGVVTNVGPTHLERLGTIDRIAQAKAELVQALPAEGAAVLNGDDPRVRGMAAKTPARRVLTYGLGPDVDLRATDVSVRGLRGVDFILHYEGKALPAATSLLGQHSVETALAAAAVGIVEELTWDEIMDGLADPDAQVRLQPVRGWNGSTILDDSYNASPASTGAALDFLAELPGRKIAVLGDMLELGSLETEGHWQVGRKAAETVTTLFTLGALGRIIGESALDAGMDRAAVHMAEDKEAIIAGIREVLDPNHVVLVKGSRGMAMEEIVAGLMEENEK